MKVFIWEVFKMAHRVHVRVHIGNKTTSTRSSSSVRRSRRSGTRSRKRRGTYAGAPAGSGKNFAALKSSLSKRRGVTNPGALTAYIGRRKYGNKRFQSMAAKGRRRAAGRRRR